MQAVLEGWQGAEGRTTKEEEGSLRPSMRAGKSISQSGAYRVGGETNNFLIIVGRRRAIVD